MNKTKAKEIGPHFFTLIEAGQIPSNRDEYKKCGKLELPVCS